MSLQIVASSQTRPVEVLYRDLRYEITDYLGGHGYTGGAADDSLAQAYIVDLLTPHGVIEPHYHDVNQYQVVIRGEGRIGRHPLRPGAIHYVDHHTTYGPIVAGPEGIAYFTLRPQVAGGRFDMPESRALKTVRSGASYTVQTDLTLPVSQVDTQCVASSPAGARAIVLRVPAGEPIPGPGVAGAGYYVILSGIVYDDGLVLPTRSCAFRPAGSAALTGQAGRDGTVIAFVAFPPGGGPSAVSPAAASSTTSPATTTPSATPPSAAT
jgi:hypothetical protein